MAGRLHEPRSGWFAIVSLILALATGRVTAAAEIARFEPPAPPPLTAKAVYVLDATSGTELFALHADMPLPPASLTKILTALVVVERAGLEDRVSIIAEDLVGPEQSQVGLVAGDTLSVRDLLLGTLIPSGNDATLALARHVGTQELGGVAAEPAAAVAAFVGLMNEKAAALGATESHLANPTGMDAEGHVMSARDIAIIAAAAMRDPVIAETVARTSATLSSELREDGYPVATTNTLLLEGLVDGIKTGTTPEAGGCLVTSYRIGPNDVIAVILGSQILENSDGSSDSTARFAETRAIFDSLTARYAWLNPAEPGTVAGLTDEMSVWDVGLEGDWLLPVPADQIGNVRYRLILGPPLPAAEPSGEVQFFVGDELLSERPAVQIG